MPVSKTLCNKCQYYEWLSPSSEIERACNCLLRTGRSVAVANRGLDDPMKCNLFKVKSSGRRAKPVLRYANEVWRDKK